MEDLIDEMFSTMDIYYPGSKRKRKEPTPKPEPVVKAWDAKPVVKPMNGKDVEFFTIGALAEALGRPVVTVRLWTRQNYLPPAPFRLPDTQNKWGDTHKGKTLYTRAMIDSAVEIFKRNGLLNSTRVEWSQHQEVTTQLAEAWSNLRNLDNTN
jgi:hypothetical protein